MVKTITDHAYENLHQTMDDIHSKDISSKPIHRSLVNIMSETIFIEFELCSKVNEPGWITKVRSFLKKIGDSK